MFGIPMPMLVDADRELAPLLLQAKRWLSYGMLSAVGFHATAALAHHYLLRDGVLASMLPGGARDDRRTAAPRPAPGVVGDATRVKGVA
jgi:cytochrome b561